jgi:hypothetical protein
VNGRKLVAIGEIKNKEKGKDIAHEGHLLSEIE